MADLASGIRAYDTSIKPIESEGWELALKEAGNALSGRVAARVHDTDGKKVIAAPVAGLKLTKFESANLDRILTTSEVPAWRIGEALAECYLEDHHTYLFPWHTGRDLRNTDASQAGADLVGFRGKGAKVRFAFGEVKTSDEDTAPPNVMYGRSGMIKQLEALCDDINRIDTLVSYIGARHAGAPWAPLYETSFKAYLKDDTDVCLVGVLVRTTKPNQDDLRTRTKALAAKKPQNGHLLALYLPIPLLKWAGLVFPLKKGGK